MNNAIKNLIKDMNEDKEEFFNLYKSDIVIGFNYFMKENPSIESISWEQGNFYNDGEDTEFRIRGISINNESCFLKKDPLKSVLEEVELFIHNCDYGILASIFGVMNTVVITKDGIKTEEYCDY